jgi:hypothetical protein
VRLFPQYSGFYSTTLLKDITASLFISISFPSPIILSAASVSSNNFLSWGGTVLIIVLFSALKSDSPLVSIKTLGELTGFSV